MRDDLVSICGNGWTGNPTVNATANEIYARVFLARDAVNERENQ